MRERRVGIQERGGPEAMTAAETSRRIRIGGREPVERDTCYNVMLLTA